MKNPKIISFSSNNGNEKEYIYVSNNYQNINNQTSHFSINNNNEKNYKNPSNNFLNMNGDLSIKDKTMINNNLKYCNNKSAKMHKFDSQNKLSHLHKSNRATFHNSGSRKNFKYK